MRHIYWKIRADPGYATATIASPTPSSPPFPRYHTQRRVERAWFPTPATSHLPSEGIPGATGGFRVVRERVYSVEAVVVLSPASITSPLAPPRRVTGISRCRSADDDDWVHLVRCFPKQVREPSHNVSLRREAVNTSQEPVGVLAHQCIHKGRDRCFAVELSGVSAMGGDCGFGGKEWGSPEGLQRFSSSTAVMEPEAKPWKSVQIHSLVGRSLTGPAQGGTSQSMMDAPFSSSNGDM